MDTWLSAVRDALAESSGLPPSELALDSKSVDLLLDLARIAAHKSGDRTNAPLLCYLLGKAQAGAGLEELAAVVRGKA